MQKISAALVRAQKAFGPALKTHTNPAFRSRYADLSACIEAVVDALNESGIALVQRCARCDSGVVVETVFVHESGEQLSAGELHVPATKNDAQGHGSALTYARRYSLMAACGIAPEDDDGNAASRKKEPTRGERRESWLADTFAAIDGAANAGELKRIVAEALAAAASENDPDAIDRINRRADAKRATAKPRQGATT